MAAVATVATAPTLRKRRWLLWTSLGLGASLIALTALVIGGAFWLIQNLSGQQRLLSWLPGLSSDAVQVFEPSGDLRSSFGAKQVRIHTKNADIVIDGLRYELRDYEVRPPLFHFKTFTADTVTVTTRTPDEPTVAPANLQLPFVLRVDALDVGKLVVRPESLAADQPGTVLQSVRGKLAFENDKHTVTLNSAVIDTLQISGDVEVGAAAPLPLTAQIQARQIDGDAAGLAWSATAKLRGTLGEIKVDSAVIAADQTLTAQAIVRPFAAVPVTTLNAAFDRLDLRKLRASLPQTSLTGKALIALDKVPLQIDINAVNTLPGSVDSGRLPIAELVVRANGAVNQPKRWTINQFNARLQGRAAAGTLTGSGEWQDGPWAIKFDARGVRLQELQSTLPALELNGEVRAEGSGIDLKKQPIALKAQLTGTALGDLRTVPIALRKGFVGEFDAQLLAEKIDLKQLKLTGGDTQLTATGKGQLLGNVNSKTWQIDSDAQWSRFDPFQWSSTASTQRAQLNGALKVTATLPANALQKVQALNLQAQLQDSRWAGQALAAKFDARLVEALTTASNPLRLESNGQARLGGNNVNWTGRIGAVSDVLRWKLDASALNELLATAKVQNTALQGRLIADGQVTGGWKTPAIKASFEGADLAASGTAVALLKGTLQAALQPDAPLLFDVTAQRVRPNRAPVVAVVAVVVGADVPASGVVPPPEVDLTLQGRGTLANHRLTAQATLRQKSRKFVLDSALTGALSFDRAGVPTGWQATVQPLTVDEEVAATVNPAGKQNWLSVATLALRWQHGAQGAQVG